MRRVRGVGRPQKIDRQEIIGAVEAKMWMNINHEDRLAKAEKICIKIASYIKDIDGIDVEVQENTLGHDPHGVKITLRKNNCSLIDVQNALRDGNPAIWIRCDQDMDGNFNGNLARISPFGLYDGEEDIVGKRLAEELKKL